MKVLWFVIEVQNPCRGRTGRGDCEIEGIQTALQHSKIKGGMLKFFG